jgi:hypothetical protein
VSSQGCDHFRGLIALDTVGGLPEPERVGLVAHLDGCRDCREDERELRELSAVLPSADPDNLDEEQVPDALPGAVLGRLRSEARRERRTRSLRYALVGSAAAAVVAIGLVLSLGGNAGSGSGSGRTVALTGEQGVHASLRFTPEAWGTSLRIEESGQPGGQVLWVSMQTTSGGWWEAGTYRTVAGRAEQVDLACALGLSDIQSVWVRDSAGHVVLRAYVA